jgi:hypothetical protein
MSYFVVRMRWRESIMLYAESYRATGSQTALHALQDVGAALDIIANLPVHSGQRIITEETHVKLHALLCAPTPKNQNIDPLAPKEE